MGSLSIFEDFVHTKNSAPANPVSLESSLYEGSTILEWQALRVGCVYSFPMNKALLEQSSPHVTRCKCNDTLSFWESIFERSIVTDKKRKESGAHVKINAADLNCTTPKMIA